MERDDNSHNETQNDDEQDSGEASVTDILGHTPMTDLALAVFLPMVPKDNYYTLASGDCYFLTNDGAKMSRRFSTPAPDTFCRTRRCMFCSGQLRPSLTVVRNTVRNTFFQLRTGTVLRTYTCLTSNKQLN